MKQPVIKKIFEAKTGEKIIATGAGAAARGAFEAGVGLVVSYPGSPITETFEILSSPGNPGKPVCHLVVNEHVGFHKAMGFALAGGRALITMKHVGFNVASDPAHYIGYTGVRGGMVVLVGTDPGALCSTGEYDFRFYSLHTHLPLIEPSSGQETLDLMKNAFAWSEEDDIPYVMALPAGACYGIEGVTAGKARKKNEPVAFLNSPEFTNVGKRAVVNHAKLMEKVAALSGKSASRRLIKFTGTPGKNLIITSGIHYYRVLEALKLLGLDGRTAVFCSAMTYPFPIDELLPYVSAAKRIIFVEDLGGFLEVSLSRFLLDQKKSYEIFGKNIFPAFGAIDLHDIIKGLKRIFNLSKPWDSSALVSLRGQPSPGRKIPVVPEREGTFCPGCPYRGFFHALGTALGPDDVIGGDIGCSSLPPHFSSWLTCMNSGTSVAAGVSLAVAGKSKVVSLIGDSTLLHSGIQTIIEAAQTDSDQICFVLDNHWTAMTGHQQSPSTPLDPDGTPRKHVLIEEMLRASGVNNISRADPYQLNNFRMLVRRMMGEKGFRVVIVERECHLQKKRRPGKPVWESRFLLDSDRCHECGTCYEKFCCPAIVKNDSGKLEIDTQICSSCGVCAQVCPNSAIVGVASKTP